MPNLVQIVLIVTLIRQTRGNHGSTYSCENYLYPWNDDTIATPTGFETALQYRLCYETAHPCDVSQCTSQQDNARVNKGFGNSWTYTPNTWCSDNRTLFQDSMVNSLLSSADGIYYLQFGPDRSGSPSGASCSVDTNSILSGYSAISQVNVMYQYEIDILKDAYETPSIFGINFKKCSANSGVSILGLENTCLNGADTAETNYKVLEPADEPGHLHIYMSAFSSDNSFSETIIPTFVYGVNDFQRWTYARTGGTSSNGYCSIYLDILYDKTKVRFLGTQVAQYDIGMYTVAPNQFGLFYQLMDIGCHAAVVSKVDANQVDPAEYTYSGTTSFTPYYSIDISGCSIAYTCTDTGSVVSGIDWCSDSIADFNTATGEWKLQNEITDTSTWPPGTYSLEVMGYPSVDSDSCNFIKHTFTLLVTDPCPSSSLTLTPVSIAPSINTLYFNGITQSFTLDIASLFTVSISNCAIIKNACVLVSDSRDCNHSDASSGTSVTYDITTGLFTFTSTDQNDSRYSYGSKAIRIWAFAATNSEVYQSIDITLNLSCMVSASNFQWHIELEKVEYFTFRYYLPSWTPDYPSVNALIDSSFPYSVSGSCYQIDPQYHYTHAITNELNQVTSQAYSSPDLSGLNTNVASEPSSWTSQLFTYWVDFTNKETSGTWLYPTRKYISVDGYTTLELDYFTTLQTKTVDLADDTAEFDFIPPSFKDNAGNTDIQLLNPEEPLRTVTFKIQSGTDLPSTTEYDEYLKVDILDNSRYEEVRVKFTKVEKNPYSTLTLTVCYQYGTYDNIADLCDDENQITIINAALANTNCVKEFGIEIPNQALADIISQSNFTLNLQEQVDQLPLLQLSLFCELQSDPEWFCGRLAFKLADIVHEEILDVNYQGFVSWRQSIDKAWVGTHQVFFEGYLIDQDPEALSGKIINGLNITVTIIDNAADQTSDNSNNNNTEQTDQVQEQGERVPRAAPDGRNPLQVMQIKITATGNLAIYFSEPILLPPIQQSATQGRILGEKPYYYIEEIVELKVTDQEEELNQIYSYSLDSSNTDPQVLKIDIEFKDTDAITTDITEPDFLEVNFVKPDLIVSAEDTAITLDLQNSSSDQAGGVYLQPQYTLVYFEYLEQLAEMAQRIGVVLSIWEIMLFFAAGKLLKALWILLHIMQFLCYIGLWQIKQADLVRITLYELKRITLGEYFDDLKPGERIMEALEIDQQAKSHPEQNIGNDRLGPTDTFEALGPTFILVSGLLAITSLLIVLYILLKRKCKFKMPQKLTNALEFVRGKVFFNPIIRYTFFNALKLNLSSIREFQLWAMTGSDNIKIRNVTIAILMFSVVNLAPIIMVCVLSRTKPEVLDSKEGQLKMGTMYKSRRIPTIRAKGERKLKWEKNARITLYPISFFYRRTIFMFATVILFDKPAIQMLIHILLTLATIIYISFDPWMFETKAQRFMEVTSEVLLLLISIAMLQYTRHDLFDNMKHKDVLSLQILQIAILTIMGITVVMNIVYMIVMGIKNFIASRKLKKLLQQNKKDHQNQVKSLQLKKALSNLSTQTNDQSPYKEVKLMALAAQQAQSKISLPPIPWDLEKVDEVEEGEDDDEEELTDREVKKYSSQQQLVPAKVKPPSTPQTQRSPEDIVEDKKVEMMAKYAPINSGLTLEDQRQIQEIQAKDFGYPVDQYRELLAEVMGYVEESEIDEHIMLYEEEKKKQA